MSAKDAYEIASRRLADEGLVAVRMKGCALDRQERTGIETFVVRIEVTVADAQRLVGSYVHP